MEKLIRNEWYLADSLSTSDVASGTGGHSFAAGDSNTNGLRVAFNSGGGGGDN